MCAPAVSMTISLARFWIRRPPLNHGKPSWFTNMPSTLAIVKTVEANSIAGSVSRRARPPLVPRRNHTLDARQPFDRGLQRRQLALRFAEAVYTAMVKSERVGTGEEGRIRGLRCALPAATDAIATPPINPIRRIT